MSATPTTQSPTEVRGLAAVAGKYLTFGLGREEYGLPVLKVREIIKLMDITAVPQAPPHVKGVINLRGKVIPVVDLRLKFQIPAQDYTERTSIVVVEVVGAQGNILMGIIVDTVFEVLSITADEIEAPPDFGEQVKTDYMRGVAKIKGAIKILLDLDRVFAVEASATDQAA